MHFIYSQISSGRKYCLIIHSKPIILCHMFLRAFDRKWISSFAVSPWYRTHQVEDIIGKRLNQIFKISYHNPSLVRRIKIHFTHITNQPNEQIYHIYAPWSYSQIKVIYSVNIKFVLFVDLWWLIIGTRICQ